jgi:hypothetical protein
MEFFFEFIQKFVFEDFLLICDSYLHKKVHGKSFCDVSIPDLGMSYLFGMIRCYLVHLSDGVPVAWYFSSVKTNEILRKVFIFLMLLSHFYIEKGKYVNRIS